MFTGLIEEVGTVAGVRPHGEGVEITIHARTVLEGIAAGDSISVDGACQTVVSHGEDSFHVQAIATTLGRTTFGEFREGRRVNLERALSLGARLGGHLVQGHVDEVGRVVGISPREEMTLINVEMPAEVAEVTVLHGSVTVNGVSLTVNALPAPGTLQVAIIPFTWDHTALADLREGDRVNLEGDLIGRYVRHLLGAPAGGARGPDLLRAWGY